MYTVHQVSCHSDCAIHNPSTRIMHLLNTLHSMFGAAQLSAEIVTVYVQSRDEWECAAAVFVEDYGGAGCVE